MGERNHHKVGDYLAQCDETGVVDYVSNMVKRWDGAFVRKKAFEGKHPHYYFKPQVKEQGVPFVQAPQPMSAVSLIASSVVGTATNTVAARRDGPAFHLYV